MSNVRIKFLADCVDRNIKYSVMFARALLRIARPHLVPAPLAPRAAFLLSSTTCTHFPRRSGVFAALSHVALKLQTSPFNFRASSLSHGSSRPALSAISTRSFFSSSDGHRPSLSEVLSIMKLKVSSVLFPIFICSCSHFVYLSVHTMARGLSVAQLRS